MELSIIEPSIFPTGRLLLVFFRRSVSEFRFRQFHYAPNAFQLLYAARVHIVADTAWIYHRCTALSPDGLHGGGGPYSGPAESADSGRRTPPRRGSAKTRAPATRHAAETRAPAAAETHAAAPPRCRISAGSAVLPNGQLLRYRLDFFIRVTVDRRALGRRNRGAS